MNFDTSQFAADLPPPRDDEPASLRRDIADELADHLECALRRELLASGGRQSPDGGGVPVRGDTASGSGDSPFHRAQQVVLTRFGNPASVARRLWLDAMQEKLMAQKITLALTCVLTAAVLFLSVVVWQTLERTQDAQRAATEAQATLAQQSEQLSATILQTLESLRNSPSPGPAPAAVGGWSPLTVKLESEEGKPVEGEVRITGTQFGGDKTDINLHRHTGSEGTVDFGMVPYGNYRMTITAIAAGETHTKEFMVAPGRPSEHVIVCPTSPPPEIALRFRIEPPQKLNADELLYLVDLSSRPRELTSGQWTSQNTRRLRLLLDASGRIIHQVSAADVSTIGVVGRDPFEPNILRRQSDAIGAAAMGLTHKAVPQLHQYTYDIQGIAICTPARNIQPLPDAPAADEYVVAPRRLFEPLRPASDFEPRPGGENVWAIEFPQYVWETALWTFRENDWARHAATPTGMQMVVISSEGDYDQRGQFSSGSSRAFVQPDSKTGRLLSIHPGVSVDVQVHYASPRRGDEAASDRHTLIRSAELISARRDPPLLDRARVSVLLLLTDAQAEAVRIAQQKGSLRIRPAEEKTAMPTLDEFVLEELRGLPDAESSGRSTGE
ncbi:MAG: hypothetical protein KF861_09145 [Planctomycetaceae bacterium]|nr:hypothetical protein [Planctomycetaceae bacterium]